MTKDKAIAGEALPLWRRYAPLVCVVALLGAFFAFGGGDLISIDTLREHRAYLTAFVVERPLLSAIGFTLIYTALVSIGFPTTIVLTLFGGYLFGMAGAIGSVIGATVGSLGLYFAARGPLGDGLKARFGGVLRRLERGFQGDSFLYLLSLRLFPFAPFIAVTLAGAAFAMPWRAFGLATFMGTMPATLIYTGVGAGAGAILDAGGTVSPSSVLLQPLVLLPLLGMALLAAAPAVWRAMRARQA
ncbi:MAG: TVP38/TMEM64 family protein [Caulobacterales bacterium]|jgi:uncharacterized membrane protein YdjX (TVP38/TMEM64 family)